MTPNIGVSETGNDGIDLDFEDGEDNLEEGEGCQNEEENDDVEADEDEVDDPDVVIADSDEELDDDILRKDMLDTCEHYSKTNGTSS
ncbi:hypothetical protein BDR04DRAFT_1159756 [Suillus decipiens]|nr:hypothetical protein BDR04DRAFT_1159756 [Suillus decipiens]